MNILTVDGVALPAPNDYKVALADLDSSETGRTESGVLVRSRVRSDVAKITVAWAGLSTVDCARVLTATQKDCFAVTYFFGDYKTATMYSGDRTAQLCAARDGQAVWNVELSLIEF